MSTILNYIYTFFLLAVLATTGCQKGPNYENEPAIEYKDIRSIVVEDPNTLSKVDSIIISVKFQDGNGDLGLAQDQVGERPFHEADTIISGGDTTVVENFFFRNYHVTPFIKKNGTFDTLKLPVPLGGQFPLLSPKNVTGPIDGTLHYSIVLFKSSSSLIQPGDTLKFHTRINDRALNISNTVETEETIFDID